MLLSQLGTFLYGSRYSAGGQPVATPAGGPPSPQGNITQAQVTRVVDGDTIEVSIGGTLYRVRYIGIDTPETVDPNRPVGCYGPEASAANKALVEGKTVTLERDVSDIDQYGRLLRYIYVGSTFVNAELVRQGYAHAYTYPPDVKYTPYLLSLHRRPATPIVVFGAPADPGSQELKDADRGALLSGACDIPALPCRLASLHASSLAGRCRGRSPLPGAWGCPPTSLILIFSPPSEGGAGGGSSCASPLKAKPRN